MLCFPANVKELRIRLQGGLGNQMFQFAFSTLLEKAIGLEPKYYWQNAPLLKPSNNTKRSIVLRTFPEINSLRIEKVFPMLSYDTIVPIQTRLRYRERYMVVRTLEDIARLDLGAETEVLFFDGYWQNVDYSQYLENEFSRHFRFPSDYYYKFGMLIEELSRPQSVAIHFRRGDYESSIKAKNFHGLCSENYFFSAIEYIRSRLPNPKFFIFSDDPNRAKSFFESINPTLVSGQSLSNVEELFLIGGASAIIMSNSSYSWWAARLLENNRSGENPIIVSPTPWFKGTKSWPLYGGGWIKLDIDSGEVN